MKIGIDARLFNQTGVGRYISNLIKNLQIIDKNNNYVLFVRSQDLDEIKKWSIVNSRWSIVIADTSWHSIEEQVQFPQILNKENLDLVHFPYFSVPIRYNRPYVLTIHDLILHHYPTGKASTLPFPFFVLKVVGYKYLIKKACKKAKKVITVSESTKEEIVDHLKVLANKIEVTYEGVDDKIISQLQAKDQRPKTNRYFLFVGNVYPHKNAERMIKAFNIFLQYFPDTLLILVGKEDFFYKRLKGEVRKMDLSSKIEFYGRVSDEDLGALYKNSIAVVVPSLMEGFGLPALEAAANKCLVLASNIKAIKEICGDNAIYFDPYNEEDMAEKMRMAYLGEFDRKIIKKGFERSKEFSFRKMAKETLKIYESVVG